MRATVFVAHLRGTPSEHLSLHASYEGAVAALVAEVRDAHRQRFDSPPTRCSARTRASLEAVGDASAVLTQAEDTATGAGWSATVEELEVAL